MRLLFLISGRRVPASRFRILQYLPWLTSRGHRCDVAASRPPKYRGWPGLGDRLSNIPRHAFRLLDAARAAFGRYDAVVLERELFSTRSTWVERLLRHVARRLVIDVDDALFALAPRKFETLMRLADHVIAGNALLADRIRPLAPCTVIPTVVDTDRFAPAPERPPGRPVVVWTGLAANIPYLEIARPALVELAGETPFRLRVIAESDAPLRRLDLHPVEVEFVRWNESTELSGLQSADIGIMPLPDNDWTRFKCGFKLIQSMAVGLPVVASPVGVNAEIVCPHGAPADPADAQPGDAGMLAADGAAWRAALARLLGDAALRAELGRTGRARVVRDFSLARYAPVFEETLAQAAGR